MAMDIGELLRLAMDVADVRFERVPTAMTEIVDGRVVIRVPEQWIDDEAELAHAIMHELGHVFRGDIASPPPEGVSAMVDNMAEDVFINWTLAQAGYESKLPILTWDQVPDELRAKGNHPLVWGSPDNLARAWAKLLPEQQAPAQAQGQGQGGSQEHGGGACYKPASEEELLEAITELLAKAGPAAVDLMKAAGMGGHTAGMGSKDIDAFPSGEAVDDWAEAVRDLMRKVWAAVERHWTREKERTWFRPGRVPYVRGQRRRRAAKVALVIDVSGSMAMYADRIAGLLGSQALDVYWVLVDERVRYASWTRPSRILGGGGTVLHEAWPTVEAAGVEAAVVVTDAEVFSPLEPPAVPTVWVVPRGADTSYLRGGDVVEVPA